jgi:dTDP-4-dehydrorhamnose reductase
MHLLITGLTGTLAPHLARHAEARGWRVSGWDRRTLPVDDSPAAQAALEALAPDAIAHLAIGGVPWSALLARHAAARALPFVFTSTAMVFDHVPDGPHDVGDARTAKDDYGRGKIACEDAIRQAHPGAVIARLGWQIDAAAVGNDMLAELDRWQARDGRVLASRRWTPACSFMDDTAAALAALVERPVAGTCHLDANAADAWTFDRVAEALKRRFDRAWHVVPDDSEGAYRHDQRLVGGPVRLPALSSRLPG